MKTKITILLLFICSIAIAQKKEYERIILDGKEAYISKKTGEIKFEKPDNNAISTTTPNSSSFAHTIKEGETLRSLSSQYGVSIREICSFNDISKNSDLKVNQMLSIPSSRTVATTKPATTSKPTLALKQTVKSKTIAAAKPIAKTILNNSKEGFHFVQKGETLYSISRQHHLSVQQLQKLNNLNSNNITAGQNLKIK